VTRPHAPPLRPALHARLSPLASVPALRTRGYGVKHEGHCLSRVNRLRSRSGLTAFAHSQADPVFPLPSATFAAVRSCPLPPYARGACHSPPRKGAIPAHGLVAVSRRLSTDHRTRVTGLRGNQHCNRNAHTRANTHARKHTHTHTYNNTHRTIHGNPASPPSPGRCPQRRRRSRRHSGCARPGWRAALRLGVALRRRPAPWCVVPPVSDSACRAHRYTL
jgi:hypothetical protein